MSSDLVRRVREYLSRRRAPASSADLAARFLRLESQREESLVVILAPLLEPAGIRYEPGLGWSAADPSAPSALLDGQRRSPPSDLLASGSASLATRSEGIPGQDPRRVACAVDCRGGRIRSVGLVPLRPEMGRALDRLRWSEISALLEGSEAIFCDPRREAPPLLAGLAARGLRGPLRVRGLASAVRGSVRLARRASPEEIAGALGCAWPEEPTAAGVAAAVAACVLEAEGIASARTPRTEVDEKHRLDEGLTRGAPSKPGTYRFYDEGGRLLYVGKAANLGRRLAAYAQGRGDSRKPGRRILGQLHRVRRVELEEAGSEIEALLRESDLIASRAPRSNVQRSVHERGRRYAPGRRRVLLLPARGGGATAIFMEDGVCAGVRRIGPRGGGMDAAVRLLRGLLARDRGRAARRRREWTEIVNSWLARNADRVSQVDLDACSTIAEGRRLLEAAIRDLTRGGVEPTWHQ